MAKGPQQAFGAKGVFHRRRIRSSAAPARAASSGALLADGLEDLPEARERLEELLAETRRKVESTGDGVEGMWLEWTIRDGDGRVVAGRHGRSPDTKNGSRLRSDRTR